MSAVAPRPAPALLPGAPGRAGATLRVVWDLGAAGELEWSVREGAGGWSATGTHRAPGGACAVLVDDAPATCVHDEARGLRHFRAQGLDITLHRGVLLYARTALLARVAGAGGADAPRAA